MRKHWLGFRVHIAEELRDTHDLDIDDGEEVRETKKSDLDALMIQWEEAESQL